MYAILMVFGLSFFLSFSVPFYIYWEVEGLFDLALGCFSKWNIGKWIPKVAESLYKGGLYSTLMEMLKSG